MLNSDLIENRGAKRKGGHEERTPDCVPNATAVRINIPPCQGTKHSLNKQKEIVGCRKNTAYSWVVFSD